MRALGTPDAGPGLRQGLEALEHSSVADPQHVRHVEIVARREAADGARRSHPRPAGAPSAVSCTSSPTRLRAFGRLVREEADAGARAEPDAEPVRASLDGLHEARAAGHLLLLVDPRATTSRPASSSWRWRGRWSGCCASSTSRSGPAAPAAGGPPAARARITLPRVGTVRRR